MRRKTRPQQIAQNFILGFMFLLIAISVTNLIDPHLLKPHFIIVDFPLHSVIETVGAIAAIMMAFLPIRRIFEKARPSYVFFSLGFLLMGLWDLFHASVKVGQGFVLTHNLSILLGGFCFFLSIFPWGKPVVRYKNAIFISITILLLLLTNLELIFHPVLPELLLDTEFTQSASIMNLLAGLFFLVAGIFLILQYIRYRELGVLILLFVSLISTITGFTFLYADTIWADNWWYWHFIRLFAFLATAGFMLWRVVQLNRERDHAMGILKENQQALLESKQKFEKLFHAVSIPLCYVNEQGEIELFNPRFTETFGYTKTDLPTLNEWWELAYPDPEYRKWVVQNWDNAVAYAQKTGKDILSDTYNVTCKDGSIRQIIIGGTTIDTHFLATFLDITSEKENERIILEEKTFTDSVINAMPGIFYLFNQEGKFIKWNRTLAELSGMSFEEVGHKSPLDFIAPYDREKVQEAISIAFTEGEVFVEADFLAKGKKNIPFYFTGIRIEYDHEPLLLGIGIDLSSRKKAEEKLKESEEKFRRIMENAQDMVYRMSLPDGVYTYVSPASLKIWGYTPEEVYATPQLISKSIHPEFKEFFKEAWDKLLKGEMPPIYEYKIIDKEGNEKWFSQRNVLIKDKEGNPEAIEGIVTDISELKNTIQELKQSNEELEQFAYVASHDLQEPLRMVASYTQLLERKYQDQLDEQAKKYIYYAVDGARRMQFLINDLLSFSRITTRGESFKKTNLNKVVASVLEKLHQRIEETGARITADHLPVIRGDASQLERLFSNLIDNALKFRQKDTSPAIKIKASEEKGTWVFSVEDNGIGFDQKFEDKVFVIFQRLHGKKQYPGTGIGLAICKRIIQRHGGEIWVDSKPGEGSTFYFTLSNG